jgi:ribosomal protein S18 acetylase RimI-like enzyme
MSSSPLRQLRKSDAEQVAALFVESYGDARLVDPEEIRTWCDNTELKDEWLRVLEEDGRVVGYVDIWPKSDVLEVDLAAPGRWDVVLDWAEGAAREYELPMVRLQVPHGHELATVVERRGYAAWRHSLRMAIELEAPPLRPSFPDGIVVRTYREDDRSAVIAAIDDAFSQDPFHEPTSDANFQEFFLNARGFDPELFFLACDGDHLAGISLCYPQRGSDEELGWVGTLGVLAPWRRRGLGEALLRHSFAELYARGKRRIGLGVDAQNVTGALRLYERVGMHADSRSDNWRKKL